MGDLRVVDADCHILEPPDIWKNWLPAALQDRAPQLVKDPEGGDAWLFKEGTAPEPIGLVTTPGQRYEDFRWLGYTYEDVRPACWDGKERLNILLIGTDQRPKEGTYNTDTLIVVSIDPTTRSRSVCAWARRALIRAGCSVSFCR